MNTIILIWNVDLENCFNSLTATLFHLFQRKIDFAAKILILHIVSMGLKCMQMYAEAYLEPGRLSTM